jgi:signal transduction histidine kinase
MTPSEQTRNQLALQASIPGGMATLESILCTDELYRRPYRSPDYEAENRALVALVSALADSPTTILQTLADTTLATLGAESAGSSLMTKDKQRFYWAAIAGAWSPHIGGGTPREFGPCGDVLDRNAPLLFTHFEKRYGYFLPVIPLVEECLLVPFYVAGESVGTVWAIAHSKDKKFDAEDLRVLESMGRFASAAYQAVESIEALRLQIYARDKAEKELRELTIGLEQQVQLRTEALINARSELAHVARVTSFGALTASIAHEVTQPIGASRNNANAALRFLAADPPDLAEVKEALESVVNETYRAQTIIGRIRDQVKRETPRKENVNLNEAIEEVISHLRGEMASNRVSVHTQLTSDLPRVRGDRVQLQQILLNLILNAIEAMAVSNTGARTLTISSQAQSDGAVRVTIADTGPGIPSGDRERIFESFFTTKPGGIGIGLWICRSIIDSHGGRLWLDDQQTGGAVFRFTLPTHQ